MEFLWALNALMCVKCLEKFLHMVNTQEKLTNIAICQDHTKTGVSSFCRTVTEWSISAILKYRLLDSTVVVLSIGVESNST